MRAREPFAGEVALEHALPLEEVTLVVERFDAFGSVHHDDAQLVPADTSLARLVPDVVVAALEPPEHEWTYLLTATTVRVPRRLLDAPPATKADDALVAMTSCAATLNVCAAPVPNP